MHPLPFIMVSGSHGYNSHDKIQFGSKVAATKALNQKLRTAQTQVGQVEPKGLGVEIGFENKGFERIACCGLHP
jgi:hypothetical protein